MVENWIEDQLFQRESSERFFRENPERGINFFVLGGFGWEKFYPPPPIYRSRGFERGKIFPEGGSKRLPLPADPLEKMNLQVSPITEYLMLVLFIIVILIFVGRNSGLPR